MLNVNIAHTGKLAKYGHVLSGFSYLPYRYQGTGPSQYIYMQITVLIMDNLNRTLPKPNDFRGMLFSGLPILN